MTSRQSGSEGYKSPTSPPSSSSEDDGFTNRPRVAGLYVKNLSREELDDLAKEGIYGPTGNPNDRPKDSGSQRSLDLPSTSRDFNGQDHSRKVTSKTPQPHRRRTRTRDASGLSENLVRRDHHGSLTMDRDPARRLENRPEQLSKEKTSHGFPAAWREPLGSNTVAAASGGSFMDVPVTEEESRKATVSRQFEEDIQRSEEISSGIHSTTVIAGSQETETIRLSPSLYAGLNTPEYDDSLLLSQICSTITTKSDDKDAPYGSPTSSLSNGIKQSIISTQMNSDVDNSRVEEVSSPTTEMRETRISSESKRNGIRAQDSTKLRPPLAVTAGTSADSGTGDSGSAEIQVDVVTSPQISSGDFLDVSALKMRGKSPGSVTPSGKDNGKQTVKPFTKKSAGKSEKRTVQLVRDYGFQPKRKRSVEDGAVLPNKFEPFPNNLYGRPLEEIDSFIYDEVSLTRSVPFISRFT